MKRLSIAVATLLSVCLPGSVRANDIVDFLRALNGPRVVPVSHRGYADHHSPIGRHSHLGPGIQSYQFDRNAGPVASCPSQRLRSPAFRPVMRTSPIRSAGRSNVSFRISFGNSPVYTQAPALQVPPPPSALYQQVPVQPVVPAIPVLPEPPRPGDLSALPHNYGDVVTCPVPLATCVEVRDLCRVAPNAVPTVIAVRDPHLSRFRSRGCVESVVYVEVLAPPCPPRVRVSPCRTKIRLDYGHYEIDIVSRNGVIEIDYDN